VKKGEVVGIIGRNGAGKSTLLKILSRITEPTHGEVDLYGRIGSLLEVGTGFHPELTGRENIYLNGQILGMRRKEIDTHFDAIVDFAEVEKFIDTPVKRYSSGMYVRLAFAVAAHLDPDILIIDEVLSVGDASFQKKCLGKMHDVAKSGRTVLFVSHNMTVITQLCTTGIVMVNGKVERAGNIAGVAAAYMRRVDEESFSATTLSNRPRPVPELGKKLCISQVRVISDSGNGFDWLEPLAFEIQMVVTSPLGDVTFGIGIETVDGIRLTTTETLQTISLPNIEEPTRLVVRLGQLSLAPGRYGIAVGARSGMCDLDYVPTAAQFQIGSLRHKSNELYSGRPSYGPVCCTSEWEVMQLTSP
jgi:lipopolysaccharide transport system ATP-binding protein